MRGRLPYRTRDSRHDLCYRPHVPTRARSPSGSTSRPASRSRGSTSSSACWAAAGRGRFTSIIERFTGHPPGRKVLLSPPRPPGQGRHRLRRKLDAPAPLPDPDAVPPSGNDLRQAAEGHRRRLRAGRRDKLSEFLAQAARPPPDDVRSAARALHAGPRHRPDPRPRRVPRRHPRRQHHDPPPGDHVRGQAAGLLRPGQARRAARSTRTC